MDVSTKNMKQTLERWIEEQANVSVKSTPNTTRVYVSPLTGDLNVYGISICYRPFAGCDDDCNIVLMRNDKLYYPSHWGYTTARSFAFEDIKDEITMLIARMLFT